MAIQVRQCAALVAGAATLALLYDDVLIQISGMRVNNQSLTPVTVTVTAPVFKSVSQTTPPGTTTDIILKTPLALVIGDKTKLRNVVFGFSGAG